MTDKKESKGNVRDAIVVGAGAIGSYVARRMAEQGMKVLLIDNRKKDTLGGWKNSGHNIDKTVFRRLPINPPSEEEIGADVETAYFDSPGKCFHFRLPMFNVRLGPFTQRMLDDAIEAGVEFRDETQCLGAVVENRYVAGVKVRSGGRETEFNAPLTVDVSGIASVVRNSLPDDIGIEKGMGENDYLNVYSEDREVGLDKWKVPFAYHSRFQGWCGPRRPGVIGIGLGRFASTGEDPRKIHPEFAKYAMPVQGKTIFKTYQRVPVRHPLHKLAGNGVMIIGDAAFQGKPLNGEGLSVMFDAAEYAARAAGQAFRRADYSEQNLWPYSMKWHRDLGARFSSFHRMRYELLGMTKDDQEFIMGLGMYGPREMSSVMLEGKIDFGPGTIALLAGVVAKGASRPRVLKRLAVASIEGMRLKKLYGNYPSSPGGLPGWIRRVEALYRRA